MIITEEQFLTYMECPIKYDFRFNKKMIMDTPDIKKVLNKTIKSFYLTMITEGRVLTLSQLTKKFDSAIKQYDNVFDAKKLTDAVFSLRNFYNWAHDNQIVVVSLDEQYTITHNNNALTGIMSPISYTSFGAYEVLKMNFGQRQYDIAVAQMNVKNAIDTIAFNSSNDCALSGIKVHHVKSGKDIITASNDIDIKRFYDSLDGVIESIKNNVYYGRDGFQCERCSYKNLCRGWRK